MGDYRAGDPSDILNSFDLDKFLFILKKSLIWMVLFFIVGVSLSFLYVRYTKPVFESQSIIKLDFESEARSLGLANNIQSLELSELSGEIELLKSKLFFSGVVDVIDMDVSYYFYGRYLIDERYKNNPFVVSYKIKNSAYYDRPFDVVIKSASEFELMYSGDDSEIAQTYSFGEEIRTEDFNLRLDKTDHFAFPQAEGHYYFTINSREALIAYLQRNVNVRPENFKAKTIRISLTDYNKYKARDLLTAIDTLYLDYTKEAKIQAIKQKINFLDNQIAETEEKLEGFESYFENFIIQNRTINLQNDLAQTIRQLDALDSIRFNLKMRYATVESLQDHLKSQEVVSLSTLSSNGLPQGLSQMLQEYHALVNERQMKLASYNENTYVVKQVDKQLSTLRDDLLESVAAYQKSLEERMEQIQGRSEMLESSFVELPSMSTEYGKNRRFYGLQEEFLLSLRQSKMGLEITRAGTVTNFVILSPANLPAVPIKPQKVMIYGVGIAFGFIASFVFVLLRYLLHNRISSLKELENLISVPVLGTVPEYTAEKLPLTRLVVKPNSKSAVSESLRTIRTNMEFLNGTKENRLITVTSTISGEGKTFVAVNLGAVIAFSNQKVCIVDLDMRKPKVHVAFQEEPYFMGMSTLLIGKNTVSECIRHSAIPNLDYIPAGPTPPNPSELILNQEYDNVLKQLKEMYDIIILDTPPVGLVTDAVLSMKKSDLQLYVVKSDYSKRSFVRSIEDLKKINQFSNLTVIFNALKGSGKGYGYGYGQGYGYGYYEEYKKS